MVTILTMRALVFALTITSSISLVQRDTGLARTRAAPRAPRSGMVTMGRRFEVNKVRMAKSQAQLAKKSSYIGKKVIVAVKASGPDPTTNRALAGVIREANALQVLRDVVDRNIKRALEPDTADFKERTYEAYAFGGVGLIINVLTDNLNRASAEVSLVVTKAYSLSPSGAKLNGGCTIANPGSVLYNFACCGRLCVNRAIDEDALLELAIAAGCEGDVSIELPNPEGRGDAESVVTVVRTSPDELGTLQAALQAAGYECSGRLVHAPHALVDVSEDDEENNFRCIDQLEELDDVSFVEHNMRVSL